MLSVELNCSIKICQNIVPGKCFFDIYKNYIHVILAGFLIKYTKQSVFIATNTKFYGGLIHRPR